MILNVDKEQCCGCNACMYICKYNAITMCSDDEGFSFPIINQDKCTDCGMCLNVCAFKKDNQILEYQQKVYAVKRKNILLRFSSQSGGVFSILAEHFIVAKNVVYGVVMDGDLKAVYRRSDSRKELKQFRGSKYVEANLNDTYLKVEADLNAMRKVLFGGTPCHVDGLIKYLEKNKTKMENLYTYDLVCHGVNSEKIFKEYIKLSEKEYDAKIVKFNFRDKLFGWYAHKTTMLTEDKRNIASRNYVDIFYSHLTLRKSCYVCPYADTKRVSDITIGDFWGIEKTIDDFADRTGCSLVIVNSKKGNELYNIIKKKAHRRESCMEDAIQPNLQNPSMCPDNRDDFWESFYSHGLKYAAAKYCDYNTYLDVLVSNKLIMKRHIKTFISVISKKRCYIYVKKYFFK